MFKNNKKNKLNNFKVITKNALAVITSLIDKLESTNELIDDYIVDEKKAADLHHANILSAQLQIWENRKILLRIKDYINADKQD